MRRSDVENLTPAATWVFIKGKSGRLPGESKKMLLLGKTRVMYVLIGVRLGDT